MIKTATILLLRKLRSCWVKGSIFLLALSVSYILFINVIFYQDWSLLIFSVAITVALHLGEQPLISKHEIKLHKVFGASNDTILPLIIGQSVLKAFIITIISLALSGISRLDEILPLSSLFEISNLWILPSVTCLFLVLLGFYTLGYLLKLMLGFQFKGKSPILRYRFLRIKK